MKLTRNMEDPESREFWMRLDARTDHYLGLPEWLKAAATQKPEKISPRNKEESSSSSASAE